jgi:hypothetical protein
MTQENKNLSVNPFLGFYLIIVGIFIFASAYIDYIILANKGVISIFIFALCSVFFVISGICILKSKNEWAVGLTFVALNIKFCISCLAIFFLTIEGDFDFIFSPSNPFTLPTSSYELVSFYIHALSLACDTFFTFWLIRGDF